MINKNYHHNKDTDEGSLWPNAIPQYESALNAFHSGFKAELRSVIQGLPLHSEMQVTDIGCGDGFYSELIAERLGEGGSITGIDPNRAYLAKAKEDSENWGTTAKRDWLEATLDTLSQIKKRFDLVWCAQSLFSFPEPVHAIKQMASLLKTGGTIAILENDTMHQMQLPWPAEMEMQIRLAEYEALKQHSNNPQKYYLGRRLPFLFEEAGVDTLTFRTQAIDRRLPFSADVRKFLDNYLEDLYARIAPFVKSSFLGEVRELMSLLSHSPQFSLCWTNVLITGRV